MNAEFPNLTPTLTADDIVRNAERKAKTPEGLRALEEDLGVFYQKEKRRDERFDRFWKCVVWVVILTLAAIAARLWT